MPGTQDLQELENRLLRGIRTVKPQATECIPGTREKILAEVATEIDDRDGPNTIWIRGAPGSGKSSISLSATSRLRRQGLLVTYFRFDRNDPETTTPTALWRIVAADFAHRLPALQSTLLQLLKDNRVDLDSPLDVFNALIQEPLSDLSVGHPLVVVIDALDECGGLMGQLSPDRQTLLQTLVEWSQLPRYFKLLVTSRDEGDITRALSSISTRIDIPSGNSVVDNPDAQDSMYVSNDIRKYLEHRFRRVRQRFPSLPADWPGNETVGDMIQCAAGIFMWAVTAANLIDCRGLDPQSRLDRLMGHTPESSLMKPLYSLYVAILEMAFGDVAHSESEAGTLRAVLSTMVLSKRPLLDEVYTQLPTSTPVTKTTLDIIRDGLSSVVAPSTNLCFTHKSFDDFLMSEQCPLIYRIRVEEFQHFLTELCLKTMKTELRFNLCDLKTSFLKNGDVANIDNKVANGISPLLSYSCCFWAEHLGSLAQFYEHIMDQAMEVIVDKLLYWFEAMSLLKETSRILPSLRLLLKWSHCSPNDEFKEFVLDAGQFIRAFSQPISQSAPHIYISALAFAPECSSVTRHFLPRFPRIPELGAGRPTHWPFCMFTSGHHMNRVNSVAFSPDENYFVSGSADETVCICDSESGNLVTDPFLVGSSVSSVFFDPGGRRAWVNCHLGNVFRLNTETRDTALVFQATILADYRLSCCSDGNQIVLCASRKRGANTMWNADTGKGLRNLVIGDRSSTVSHSPDVFYIACLEPDDTTIRILKVRNGSQIEGPHESGPLLSHYEPISALAFSVDGMFVASGSVNGTVLIWDSETGDTISYPLDTGDEEIDAVAYSHQRGLIVSASGNRGEVAVWNALTHELVLGPLYGHASWITSIVLSRDGQRAVTASEDRTVRMWDLDRKRNELATDPSKGHMFAADWVAFSSCGEKVVSVDRREIRVWDAQTCEPLRHPFRHFSFSRVIVSPDGRYIMACDTNDGILRVWNTDTGLLKLHHELNYDNQEVLKIFHLSFRSSDQKLVMASKNGAIYAWSLENGSKPECLSPSPNKLVAVLALSPDGVTAIVRDDSKNPRHYVWCTVSYQPLPVIFVNDENITEGPMAYSGSGRFFVAASCGLGETTLRVWDMQNGKLATGPLTVNGRIRLLAFSSNNYHIAFSSTANSTVIWIWDVRTRLVASEPLKGHTGDITALAFSPDGGKLASGSRNGCIRIWNVADVNVGGNSQVVGGHLGSKFDMGRSEWAVGTGGEMLFWMPSYIREEFVWPRLKDGENWTECFRGGCV